MAKVRRHRRYGGVPSGIPTWAWLAAGAAGVAYLASRKSPTALGCCGGVVFGHADAHPKHGAFEGLAAFGDGTGSCSPSVLLGGQRINVDEPIVSPSGEYFAKVQNDGNFVVRQCTQAGGCACGHDQQGQTSNVKWGANQAGQGATYATFNSDGNFVLRRPDGSTVWGTDTAGKGSFIEMGDNGNLVVWGDQARTLSKVHWASWADGDPNGPGLASTLGTIGLIVGAAVATIASAGAASGILVPSLAAGLGGAGAAIGAAGKLVSTIRSASSSPAQSAAVVTTTVNPTQPAAAATAASGTIDLGALGTINVSSLTLPLALGVGGLLLFGAKGAIAGGLAGYALKASGKV